MAFALQHVPEESIAGVVQLFSEDGPRTRQSAREPQSHWWEPRAMRQEQRRAQDLVRIVAERWVIGAPNLLFPQGVRTQYLWIRNDSDRERIFSSDVPAGYKVSNYTLPLETNPPAISPSGTTELIVEALPERLARGADREWLEGRRRSQFLFAAWLPPPADGR